MQILPGIFLINGSPYGRHQNGYLVHAEGATILIDSGDLEGPSSLPDVERNARRWGFELAAASHLFITHEHFDHASHAAELRRRGIRTVAGRAAADAIAAGDERCIGYAVHKTFEPAQTDVIVEDGQAVEVGGLGVRCIAAPGHAAGLVVWEIVIHGERCWFCGDMLLTSHAHRTTELCWTGGPDFDRKTYIDSLRKLSQMPVDHVFPGHGPAAIGCGKRVIEMTYTQALTKWR